MGADALCVGVARLPSDRDMDGCIRSEGWTKTTTDSSMSSSPLANGSEAGARNTSPMLLPLVADTGQIEGVDMGGVPGSDGHFVPTNVSVVEQFCSE